MLCFTFGMQRYKEISNPTNIRLLFLVFLHERLVISFFFRIFANVNAEYKKWHERRNPFQYLKI